jgi:hypothetical protein
MEKRILDDETRSKMLGLAPFSATAEIEFTPEIYKNKGIDDNFIPVFTIRPFTLEEKPKATKTIIDHKVGRELELANILRANVLNWRNLFDAGTKEEILYKADPAGGADKEVFKILPSTIIAELLFFITKISGLVDQERLGLK